MCNITDAIVELTTNLDITLTELTGDSYYCIEVRIYTYVCIYT